MNSGRNSSHDPQGGEPIVSYKDCDTVSYRSETGAVIQDDSEYPYAKALLHGCIYCGRSMRNVIRYKISAPGHLELYFRVRLCEFCGWWTRSMACHQGQDISDEDALIGVAKRFNVSQADVPINDLRIYLSKHPHDLAHVNPFAFEQLIFECLKDRFGADVEVIKIGGRKDRGIDILLIRNRSEKTLVQIKRRKNISLAEGVSVVRELNGVLFREQVAKGMVITTAKKFSSEARKEAKIEAVEKHEVGLFTFGDVVNLLGVRNYANSYAPWDTFPDYLPSEWQTTYYEPEVW
jgi:hypothetical protein